MLELLRRLPPSFETRDAGVAALEAEGLERPLAQWMATNLVEVDGAYRLRIDLDDMEALLRDFFRVDLWGVIESPPDELVVHVVKASASNVLDGDALRRVEAAAANERVHLHVVEGGHWLNAENPQAVEELLVGHL
jgi:esterase